MPPTDRDSDGGTVRSASQLREGFQHRLVGLAAAVLLDALVARDVKGAPRRPLVLAKRDLDELRLADPGFSRDESELSSSTRGCFGRSGSGSLPLRSCQAARSSWNCRKSMAVEATRSQRGRGGQPRTSVP
jgi:hypothetical protein